uniref:TRASH domain-containing protein n=1 Tax=Chromera velia CCMP2878 TaxID=1169474 RepID=A0A0G4G6M6_9ALVE|eukprot:Cvel_20458.t1-p1 / transcript=Cvel_20458.t1 / gene=Cvel_20458 / organism=Chromera_velia_CCMP2878 / gene_product=hypothetical protein / transcript_product=hypothetical protein / location=Cvel_scaffold1836:12421-12976(+) / protein_length=114 / sequence_SO=supercontig / SO=protein_coding / is_pseudo=false
MSRVLVFLALMTALTGVRCFLSPAPPLPFPRRQHQSLYGAFVHLRTSRVLPTFFSVGAKGAEREHQSTLSAKPRSRLPERTAYVVCSKCQYTLYKYKKNGKGSLVSPGCFPACA